MKDRFVGAGLAAGSFLLLLYRYWFPPEKIFDEVYFARAAEEYLQRRYIYENTHPPVTKLLITFSTILFGGLHRGDTSAGWRFLDVVAGALAVWLLFVLARRITHSTLYGAYAAGLFALDGMHFVQSRIATPESFVVCFSLATLYTFYRYWEILVTRAARPLPISSARLWLGAAGACICAVAGVALRFPHESRPAQIAAAVIAAAALYVVYRVLLRPPEGWRWLALFTVSAALLVASKWYGVMAYGVAFTIVAGTTAYAAYKRRRPQFPVDLVAASVIAAFGIVYALAYIPHFIGLRDLQTQPPRPYTLSDIVTMQVNAYLYHAHLDAKHPYSSLWWQWPLDLRPVLYYATYGHERGVNTAAIITSLASPILLWLGLVTVPAVGILAILERNRGYALVVLTYLAQWLPWMFSPRIAFAYHFYVDIPLICLCSAIAMQRLYAWMRDSDLNAARTIVAGYFAVAAAWFVYYYPILSGMTIPYASWMQRMWLHSWI
ncbi:MAG: phospholipid carrier-dependent glycosyltransferase [Candidatus Eremiobacteraeota bacterium]|nr:phospholipid carrier-dependent glycosyltransferase [Candidatus Eremiobacteraeota bacterium]